MTTEILESPSIIKTRSFKKISLPIARNRELVSDVMPVRRFGLSDLWDIRRKRGYATSYRRQLRNTL